MIRLLIADDDELIREALEITLSRQTDIRIVKTVGNGNEALSLCLGGEVDVALLDIRMPVLDGIKATELIRAGSGCRVLLLSTFHDPELARAAMVAGASGYLLKGCGSAEIADAIRLVARGNTVFREEIFLSAATAAPGGAVGAAIRVDTLTPREREIARLISRGYSNREAAEALGLSEGTVKNYVSAILDKLGLRQRTQIAVYFATGKKEFSD